jgi:hypothetical protein
LEDGARRAAEASVGKARHGGRRGTWAGWGANLVDRDEIDGLRVEQLDDKLRSAAQAPAN